MNKVLLVAFLFVAGICVAQEKNTIDKDTSIEFKTKLIDYGKIDKGSNGVRSFEFKNTGEHPLKIYSVYSACSCDIVYQPEEHIAPGATSRIDVKYDTDKIGPIVKTITVRTNTEEKLIPLNLRGEVLETNEEEKPEEDENKDKRSKK